MEMDLTEIARFAFPILAVAVGWGALVQKTKGQDARLNSHSRDLREHVKQDNEVHTQMIDRLARIETKLDSALTRE